MATNNAINRPNALQADQETSTSLTTFVSPGVQQYHPSAAKAWCKVSPAGTIAGSYNVTSVGVNGTGDVTYNWTVVFSSVNYSVDTDCQVDADYKSNAQNTSYAAGLTRVIVHDTGGVQRNPNFFLISAFGDQ